jgi:DNA (cytosine-5)-methyltransferase 1
VTADVAFDLSKAAVQSYNWNLAPVARIADLTKFTPEGRTDVLLAGAPCQGFSTVGKRREHDPRNALLGRVAEIARLVRPRAVVVENVPAALSGTHRVHWLALEAALAGLGYNVRRIELRGEESALAQRRRRIFMICWRGSDCLRLDVPTRSAPTLRSVLSGVECLADHQPKVPAPGSVDALVARRIGAGRKLCNVRSSPRAVATWDVPEVFGETAQLEKDVLRAVSRLRRRDRRRRFGDGDPVAQEALERELGWPCGHQVGRLVDAGYLRLVDDRVELRHTYNGKYRRLDWGDLSPTVDTHFGRPALFLHPDEDRGLSAREAARIQGFPDAYALTGNRGEQFEMVGNAVPPPMAGRVAAFVREAILKG